MKAEDCYRFGQLCAARKQYGLAREVLTELLQGSRLHLKGRVTKAMAQDAQTILRYIETVESVSENRGRTRPKKSTPGSGANRDGAGSASVSGSRAPDRSSPAAKEQESPVPEQPATVEEPNSDVAEELPEIGLHVATDAAPLREALRAGTRSDRETLDLALAAYKHSFRVSYEQLICLPTLRNIESLWYQEDTARKVMKDFRGRAILADEVGLGKTIEAGIIMKEYLARGLISSVLVLTPSSLVGQWHEELREKFGLDFVSSNDPLFRKDSTAFWNESYIVASLHAARTQRHFEAVTSRNYDLVIVDEAHHLKNQQTKGWKLVNAVKKTFLLLLTATPVQNNLDELYNLVTLLRPGHLSTRTAFKEEFVTRGNPTDPRNRQKLKQLLKKIMVRNTRSVTKLHLPPRLAMTTRIEPSEEEDRFYAAISELVSDHEAVQEAGLPLLRMRRLMESAGSSHVAALGMVRKLRQAGSGRFAEHCDRVIDAGERIGKGQKTGKVLDLIESLSDQAIVFVNFVATLEHLRDALAERNIPHVLFYGGLSSAQKKKAIEDYGKGCKVLLATGTGGEGFNLQFSRIMVNYDLPWNPMEIEQRIGRIHRIGQERDVYVYNFCATGSLEDHILDVLDRKINMFELVVGEIDMILGRLQGEQDFGDMVFELWTKHPDEAHRRKAFEALGARLKRAKTAYRNSKELDEKLFREDFGA
jgi:SNF2 family DNA or RNA helicase